MGMCPLGGLTLGNPSVSRKSVENRPKEEATFLDDWARGADPRRPNIFETTFEGDAGKLAPMRSIPTLRPSHRFVQSKGWRTSMASRTLDLPFSVISVSSATTYIDFIREKVSRMKNTYIPQLYH